MVSHAATFAFWSIVLLGRHCYFAVLRHHLPGFFQTISVGLKPAPAVPPTEIGRQNVERPVFVKQPCLRFICSSSVTVHRFITQDGSRIWSRFDYTEKVENDDGKSAT